MQSQSVVRHRMGAAHGTVLISRMRGSASSPAIDKTVADHGRTEVAGQGLAARCAIEHQQRHPSTMPQCTPSPQRRLQRSITTAPSVEDGRFTETDHTPQTVFRMTEDGHDSPDLVSATVPLEFVAPRPCHGNTEASAICCAIQENPQLWFRCFMSTTAAITSGSAWAGLALRIGENSRGHAESGAIPVRGIDVWDTAMDRAGPAIKAAHRPATTRSAERRLATVFATDSGSAFSA